MYNPVNSKKMKIKAKYQHGMTLQDFHKRIHTKSKKMAESRKSISDIKQSVSEYVQEVQQTVSNATKDLIEKDAALVSSWKAQIIQKPTTDQSTGIANEYEMILQENIDKLKTIAKQDFKTSYANTQELIEETKQKLHNLIAQTFKHDDSKEDFTETTNAIFANVNKKIRTDLVAKSTRAERSRNSLSPDIGQVFVNPINKPPEEIEAEHLLQQLFEKELLEFNEQIRSDFNQINLNMAKLVDQTKQTFDENIQTVAATGLLQISSLNAAESKSLPNLPTESSVGHNINTLLAKAGEDFQQVNDNMTADVTKNQRVIQDNVKYYSEKMLRMDFLNRRQD
ncbi:hypothetical protein D910_03385 [Dendroctonus ponderosae]|uniref:Uncharacterized protein n=2 Tax=Dendroctonus ponderosae TaxID=77166 RepID=U4U5U1_DENPD|nr:hypothetical protein D910_03385 [Dendroctonus ponderosae]